MTAPVVVDSTCLIGLEQIGLLDLLPALFDPICAPPEVEREFGGTLRWLRIEPPNDHALVAALGMMVDGGEAEAIALAAERGWPVVLDDRRARGVAQRLGLEVVGTIGILIRAKRASLLPEVGPALEDLEKYGFYISESLKSEALRLGGE